MDSAAPPVKRGRGRPPKSQQQPIDPSQPLHPWASTSKVASHSQQRASPSTSYVPLKKAHHHQQQVPQQQYAVAPHPHIPIASAAAVTAPISATSFYAHAPAQPPLQQQYAYENGNMYVPRASVTPAPMAEPHQYVIPMMPRQNIPTRKDLEFLLGGSLKVRDRSSTPNLAALQTRHSVAPVDAGQRRSVSAGQYHAQAQAAGPSTSSMQPQPQRVFAIQPPYASTSQWQASAGEAYQTLQSHVFPGDEKLHDYNEDDGLALGAEAVMESDHDYDGYADAEDDAQPYDYDDPNDRDFRPSNPAGSTSRRVSRNGNVDASAAALAIAGSVSTPPRQLNPEKARRSLGAASSSGGKVPGSATKPASEPTDEQTSIFPRKRVGRWRKEDYTPAVIEKMKAANEILAVALEASAVQQTSGDHRKKRKSMRLDDVLDRKTVQSLSPEMQEALRRARNTQLQRERRSRLRAEGKWPLPSTAANPRPRKKVGEEGQAEEERKKARKRKTLPGQEDDDGGSGSGIVERARGKVVEWIKNVSSEAADSAGEGERAFVLSAGEGSFETGSVGTSSRRAPGNQRRSTSQQTHTAAAIAGLPAEQQRQRRNSSPLTPRTADKIATMDDVPIDPRLQGDDVDGAGEEGEGFFSRFGTVTGKLLPQPATEPIVVTTVEGEEAGTGTALATPAAEAEKAYEPAPAGPAAGAGGGGLGDEYYFST